MPDTSAPAVSIRARKDYSSASGMITITATATDNIGVSRVEFYVNGVLASTATAAPYSFNWDSTAVTNGSYSLFAKVYDATGNVGQSGKIRLSEPNVKFH